MEINSHIFHIDTILDIDRRIWIIDKKNPSYPLLKLSEWEFNLIKSNIFQSKNNRIKFNGEYYYLDTELINRIKIASKNNFDITNLSFSMREYLDKNIIDNLKYTIKFTNLKHLKNSSDDIYIIYPEWMKVKYDKIIDKKTDKLKEHGFNIKGIYWIDEYFYTKDTDLNVFKRGLIITTHLSGYIVKNDVFDSEFTKYNNVTYYENNDIVIDNLKNNIKNIFKDVYDKSDVVISKSLDVTLVSVTNNEFNPFKESTVSVYTSKIVESFKSFIGKRIR